LLVSDRVTQFSSAAVDDCTHRLAGYLGPVAACSDVQKVVDWASAAQLEQVVMHYAPIGPAVDTLTGLSKGLAARNIALSRQMRDIDQQTWPSATAGFFKFKRVLPNIITQAKAEKLS
jgi:deoxyribodipyrimidine photo-lyase